MNLNYFVDKHTKNMFYVPQDQLDYYTHHGIDDYLLIDWCKQYLSPTSTFLDIGSQIGAFSIILSKYCKQVYSFDYNIQHCTNLSNSVKMNNIHNIKIHQNNGLFMIDTFHLTNIHLIKIYHDLERNFIGLVETLEKNFYPPIIYYDPLKLTTVVQFLTLKGYTIHAIGGCQHWYLASDHTKYKTKNNVHHLQACEDIVLSPQSSPDLISNTLANAFQYMTQLPHKQLIYLNIPLPVDRVPNNPSLCQTNDGYLCNVRASNYVYEPQFRFLDDGQIHKSDHYLLTLNDQLMITSTKKLKDVTNNIYYPSFVEGIDDLRLINHQYFLCSHGNFNNNKIINQCLGTYNNKGEVTRLIPLKGPNEMRHEKNWLPFIQNDQIYVIYTIHPFMLYQVDAKTGDLTLIKNENLTHFNLTNFRGSAGPINYKGGWLMTCHQVCHTRFNYFHRFVWIDQNLTTLKHSLPFYFELKGVEFNCGLCLDENQDIVITHSIWDNHSRLIVVDHQVVDDMLKID